MIEKIENDFLRVEVSFAGAELKSIFQKQQQKEYLWQGSAEWWPRRAPVLFPIVGKLQNNSYKTGSKTYSLPQHGFARDKEFQLEEKSQNKLCFVLSSSEELLKIYPYHFDLRIRYELTGSRLRVNYEITNKGEAEQFFSIGAHPGFICPLNENEKFTDYYLEFEKEETLDRYLLDEGLFNGKKENVLNQQKTLDLSEELFKKDAIVFKNMKSSFMFLKSRKSNYSLKFEHPGFPYFGIWKKTGATFICLEPWCGIADNIGFNGELKDKEGIVALEKGKKFSRDFFVEIG